MDYLNFEDDLNEEVQPEQPAQPAQIVAENSAESLINDIENELIEPERANAEQANAERANAERARARARAATANTINDLGNEFLEETVSSKLILPPASIAPVQQSTVPNPPVSIAPEEANAERANAERARANTINDLGNEFLEETVSSEIILPPASIAPLQQSTVPNPPASIAPLQQSTVPNPPASIAPVSILPQIDENNEVNDLVDSDDQEEEAAIQFVSPYISGKVPDLLSRKERPSQSQISAFSGLALSDLKTRFQSEGSIPIRDRIVAAMTETKQFPTEWTAERESSGLYPNVEDPEFTRKLFAKREFFDLYTQRKIVMDTINNKRDPCSEEVQEMFVLTPVQKLVSRFMNSNTPYMGQLIYHGVGVGKTCSAVSIAEKQLDMFPNNKVYIIAPSAVQQGFRRTIFNKDALRPATQEEIESGDRFVMGKWRSSQCTGTTYIELVNGGDEPNADTLDTAIRRKINERYEVVGYRKFKNDIVNIFKARIPAHYQGAARIEKQKDILHQLFSDHCIIVDEAHNMRDDKAEKLSAAETGELDTDVEPSDAPETGQAPAAIAAQEARDARELADLLLTICESTEGTRLVLMTATPMYNTAREIVFLLNLLLLNDTKNREVLLVESKLFNKDGSVIESEMPRLRSVIKRYVSYMRGENPFTFPLRLSLPIEKRFNIEKWPTRTALRGGSDLQIDKTILTGLNALSLVVHPLKKGTMIDYIMRLKMQLGTPQQLQIEAKQAGLAISPDTGIPRNLLDAWFQVGNITYKDSTYGTDGWKQHFSIAQSPGRHHGFRWKKEGYTVDTVFSPTNLPKYSPKIAAMVESANSAAGICFFYSRYVLPGALPMAIALERTGYSRRMADDTIQNLLISPDVLPKGRKCAMCPGYETDPHFKTGQSITDRELHRFYPACYVFLCGDASLSPNFDGLVKKCVDFPDRDIEAPLGARVKVIIGSQVAAEGLDFKCVREVHLLEPWYHLNRVEQIVGRAVRYCSHAKLPFEMRNVLIYLHAVSLDSTETADLYAYRIAVTKARNIGRVQRELKINAWDCNINLSSILLQDVPLRYIVDAQSRVERNYEIKDEPYSNICDYMETCDYRCALDIPESIKKGEGIDDSTYTQTDAHTMLEEREERIRRMFELQPEWPITQVRAIYKGVPPHIAAIGIRSIIDNPKFRVKFGNRVGYLIQKNNYILFQPNPITSTEIPLAMRYASKYGGSFSTVIPTRGPFGDRDVRILVHQEDVSIASVAAEIQPDTDLILNEWIATIELASQATKVLPITLPTDRFEASHMQLVSWIAKRFVSIPESRAVIARMGFDYLFTQEQKLKLLKLAALNKASANTQQVLSTEVFYKTFYSAFVYVDIATGKIVTMYHKNTEPPEKFETCPSNLLKQIEETLGLPVDEKLGSASLMGFLSRNEDEKLIFKSRKYEDRGYRGQECANGSGLIDPKERILRVYTLINESADTDLKTTIVPDGPKVNGKHDRVPEKGVDNLNELSRAAMCVYMEFICRLADARKISKTKRSFLSLFEKEYIVQDLSGKKR